MCKVVCSAPDANQKLLDDLHWLLTSIGARLRKIPLPDSICKLDALEQFNISAMSSQVVISQSVLGYHNRFVNL